MPIIVQEREAARGRVGAILAMCLGVEQFGGRRHTVSICPTTPFRRDLSVAGTRELCPASPLEWDGCDPEAEWLGI